MFWGQHQKWGVGLEGNLQRVPQKGRSGGRRREGGSEGWWRGGRSYIRKRCTFPVAFAAEKGKAKTEKRRPKEGNAVLCKLS